MSTRIELAVHADEAELRKILVKTAMPGIIRLSYGREPHFFNSLGLLGQRNQIVVARNTIGNIVGFGIRSIKSMYINSEVQQIGYLSNLRLEKKYRGNILLAKGFKYLHELHQDAQCPFYLTTIMTDNENAKEVLLNARGLLPVYQPWGKLHTYLINSSYIKSSASNPQIEFARPADREEILTFLQQEGKHKQFFPHYTENDFNQEAGLLRGIQYKNILIAKQNKKIVATLGLWNQNPFKQILVHSYHPLLTLLRPIYNVYSKIRNKPCLVRPGNPLDFYYAAIVCVKHNDPTLFRHILSAAVTHSRQQNKSFFALGLHENDPLNNVLNDFRYKLMQSNLYIVSFPSDNIDLSCLKNKVPYLELGAL
jgi:hypothetical protein